MEPRALILGTTKLSHNIKDGQGKPTSNSEQEDYNSNGEPEHQGSAHHGERHLKHLKENYWKTLIDAGAKVHKFSKPRLRFGDGQGDNCRLNSTLTEVQIQEELVCV